MTTIPSSHHSQRGYLLEIPIILFVVLIVLAILLPRLPPTGQKVLIGIVAVAIVFCLFYMIVVPGWTSGESSRGWLVWRVALFLACAAVLITGAGAFILR
jgi:hypothetical protein